MQPKKLSRIAEHVERCQPLWRRADRRVTFGDENPVSLSVFLDCFEVGDSHLAKDGDEESPLEVALKKDAACDQLGTTDVVPFFDEECVYTLVQTHFVYAHND